MIHDAVVQTWIPSRRPAVMVRSAVPNVSFEFFALLVHTTIYYQVSIIPRTGYQYKQCSIRTINTRYNLLRVLAVSAPSNPEILEVQQYLEHRTPKYYFGIYEYSYRLYITGKHGCRRCRRYYSGTRYLVIWLMFINVLNTSTILVTGVPGTR